MTPLKRTEVEKISHSVMILPSECQYFITGGRRANTKKQQIKVSPRGRSTRRDQNIFKGVLGHNNEHDGSFQLS